MKPLWLRLRPLAAWALVGATLVVAGCDSVVPRPSSVEIDRPDVQLPTAQPEPPRPSERPEAPDFLAIFPEQQLATLTGVEPCATWPDTTCTMGPDHYYSSGFGVAFDVLDGEWTNTVNWPNALELRDGRRSITFLSGAASGCSRGWHPPYYWFCSPYPEQRPVTAASLRDDLLEHRNLDVSPLDSSMRIDRRPTETFDVRSPDKTQWGEGIVSIASGDYALGDRQALRLSVLQIDGEAVIVALEAPEKSFERYLVAMQPVLDSIRFEDFR